MRAVEERVLDAIDLEGMLAYLCDLVAVPSLDGEETAAQEHVAAQMRNIGLDVDIWAIPFDTLSQHPAHSQEVEREHGLGVVGSMGRAAADGKSLIYNGHVDVVPAGDLANWHYPPWQGTIDNGRVYGRGPWT